MTSPSEQYPDAHHDVSSNTIFGFWLYLMTDFILFATFFAVFAVLRNNTFGGPTAQELFSLPFALAETLVLLTSSLTCGMASLALPRNDKKSLYGWYGATFLLGAFFLGMMYTDFAHLVQSGNSWSRSGFLSSYFTLIGLHGLHIVIALLFMVFFLAQVWVRGLIPVTIRRLTCLKMFWFFSCIVWVFMFTIIYLIGAT
ncbi:MAG TPA: cytochrome c oxidase subunit 3 [Chlamydiales bacterium]|jgi:cytochrome o ubiquinol oxidase subunit 3|nr:cytochrome c oxidase subunit 3 [Chlamydiales bacterium]